MKFKKGNKVEVMNKKEALTSWRFAEIISGNGHTYSVRYDCSSGKTREEAVERVSRKAIRPIPPQLEGAESWLVGDIVEVFDEDSWKMARVLKDYDGDYYLVHALGISFKVHKLNIRMRQSWQNDKWVVIGKGSGSCMDVKSNCYQKKSFRIPQTNAKTNPHEGDNVLAIHNNTGFEESHIVSSMTLKRQSPYCLSLLEQYTGNFQKRRAIEQEGRIQQVGPTQNFPEKVDAVAYQREYMGEKYMHSSSDNRSDGYFETERRKLTGVVGCSLARSSENNDCDSDECSVGSCSAINRSTNKFPSHFIAIPCEERDTLCSDAESFSGEEEESCSLPREEEVAENIHRLELHAYRCTLEALYASGPLTWEKEALLTNLRITLNISNDEHLMELRNLISAGTGILR
ncbi:hypothetical protein LguiA_036453 [Lonicera macranthoides]